MSKQTTKDRLAAFHAGMDAVANPSKECQYCGRTIRFVEQGVASYKWMTGPDKDSWKCPAPGYPVRSHTPKD